MIQAPIRDDEDLLCNACERRFGPWDHYAAECLLHNFASDARGLFSNGEVVAYQVDNWEEAKIRMFVLSLLWRASTTTHSIFTRVTLGPHAERVKQFILAGDPGSPDDFSVLLCRGRRALILRGWRLLN